MDVCLLCVFCVVRYRFLRRADHSSRGVPPSVVCLSVIAKLRKCGDRGPLEAVLPWTSKACRLRSHSLYRPLLRNVMFPSFLHPYTLISVCSCTQVKGFGGTHCTGSNRDIIKNWKTCLVAVTIQRKIRQCAVKLKQT